MQKAPPARPVKSLPMNIIVTFCAKIINVHPIVNGITKLSIVHFLPNLFIKKPIGRQDIAAPKENIDVIQ